MAAITNRIRPHRTGTAPAPPEPTAPTPSQRTAAAFPGAQAARWVWGVTRLALGWVFLWAFLDKTLGLGHETTRADAWIHGGSPTQGFLAFSAQGPLTGFYHAIAGAAWADTLFMIGLAGIGLALMLGIGMRIATVAGIALLIMMYTVVLPPANNLFMDDHVIYALTLAGLALSGAEKTLGLGRVWQQTGLVRRLPWLA